jgi:uncharacterized membrane protein
MSSVSQTPPRTVGALRGRSWRTAAWPAIVVAAAVAAIVALALAPVAPALMAQAARTHLRTPDLALLAGLPRPIQIHLAAALLALGLGAALMVVRKGRTFHRAAGWAWVGLVAVTAGSSLFITTLRPGHFSLLHLLTAWVLIILPLGVFWAKRHSVARHRRTMMGIFYGGFAFNLAFAFIPGRVLWRVFFG